jgi:hypothetical protein
MSIHPFPPQSDDTDAQRAACYQRFLHELIDFGMDIARAIDAQTKACARRDSAAPDILDIATAFERVSRGVRRGIMLAQRVDTLAPSACADQHRASARRRIIREVEDAIQRDARPAKRPQRQAKLHDWLDRPDIPESVDHRPIPEIIAEICRDLGRAALPGLKPYKRQTPDDIIALCKLAARSRRASTGLKPAATEPECFVRLAPSPKQE